MFNRITNFNKRGVIMVVDNLNLGMIENILSHLDMDRYCLYKIPFELFREVHLPCFNKPQPMFKKTQGPGLVETHDVTTIIALYCQFDL